MIFVDCLYSGDNTTDGLALREQQRRCHKSAQEFGWMIHRDLFDPTLTPDTALDDRGGIQQLLEDANNHCIDVLMVTSLDRIAADSASVAAVLRQLQDNGVALYDIQFSSLRLPQSKTLMQFVSEMADVTRKERE